MDKLIEGFGKFRRQAFGQYQSLFRRLSQEGQKPHTLFITCADSRVLAEFITHSKPGELFVVKNVGNIVPPSHLTHSTNATAAAIEFAIDVLEVNDIVVCGHTQCGAIEALFAQTPALHKTSHLAHWLELAASVRQVITTHHAHLDDHDARMTAAAQENVLLALANLRTFPTVCERLAKGSLRLHGWMFTIATAELSVYDPDTRQFAARIDVLDANT